MGKGGMMDDIDDEEEEYRPEPSVCDECGYVYYWCEMCGYHGHDCSEEGDQ